MSESPTGHWSQVILKCPLTETTKIGIADIKPRHQMHVKFPLCELLTLWSIVEGEYKYGTHWLEQGKGKLSRLHLPGKRKDKERK